MSKTLVILEVSQKQKYIFLSKKLRENVLRSNEINYVTSPAFFEKVASEYYHETGNFIYTGGGHAVLQFADEEQARKRSMFCVNMKDWNYLQRKCFMIHRKHRERI